MWWIRESGDPVDLVIIVPEPDRRKEIGQKLLALAENPSQVQWVSWPQAGFKVPAELYRQFSGEPAEPVTANVNLTDNQDASVTTRRRPGRPRKNPVPDTDNNEKGE